MSGTDDRPAATGPLPADALYKFASITEATVAPNGDYVKRPLDELPNSVLRLHCRQQVRREARSSSGNLVLRHSRLLQQRIHVVAARVACLKRGF